MISILLGATLALVFASSSPERASSQTGQSAWTDTSPHRTGFVNVKGARLNYLDWGGTGPNLILIHGLGDNPHVFDDLVPALGNRFRIIAYAQRGHGRSSKEGPFDTGTLTEDLRALMDSLRIPKASLAGWSMGGNEITEMAGKYPDRVDRIVYLEGAYDWSDPAFTAALGDLPVALDPTPQTLGSLDAFRSWQNEMFFPGVPDPGRWEAYIRDLVNIQADGRVRPVMSDSVMAALFKALTTGPRKYSSVTAPALAIYAESFLDVSHGQSGQRAKNAAWEEKYMRQFRAASIVRARRELKQVEIMTVPGTHMTFLFSSRDRVAEAMKRFLEGSPMVPGSGVVTLSSPHTFDETLARLRAAVTRRGLTLFLDLDQQAAARADGVEMRRAHLLLFGRPRAGTPILQAVPEAGVDLPLKAYLWEAANGGVSVSYSDPAFIIARHHLSDSLSAPLKGVVAIVAEAVAP